MLVSFLFPVRDFFFLPHKNNLRRKDVFWYIVPSDFSSWFLGPIAVESINGSVDGVNHFMAARKNEGKGRGRNKIIKLLIHQCVL